MCIQPASHKEGLLAGRVDQLSPLCLGLPLGQSGLPGSLSAGMASEQGPGGKPKRGRSFESSKSSRNKTQHSSERNKIPV